MKTLVGADYGHGIAYTPSGSAVHYVLVEPDPTLPNLQILGQESARWRKTAETYDSLLHQNKLDIATAYRASFADRVMALAAEGVREGANHNLFAQSDDGKIIGVMIYSISPRNREGFIMLLAVDPVNLSGSPGSGQLRGIGTGLVAGASRQLLREEVQTVYLHPLDPAARAFWKGRGFGVCGGGGRLCVRGREAVGNLINGCAAACEGNDCYVFCGEPRLLVGMRTF